MAEAIAVASVARTATEILKSTPCRIPIRHGGSETRRNPPLQLSQIPYAVTTRLLHSSKAINRSAPERRFLCKVGQSPVQCLHQFWSLDVRVRPPAGRGHPVRSPCRPSKICLQFSRTVA